MSKKQFSYLSKTGIGDSVGFSKKGLAEFSVNVGNVCEFGCSYCYVPDQPFKHPSVKALIKAGHNIDSFSNYRDHKDVISTVTRDLKKISPDDTSTVIFCTTCDPCATDSHAKTTIAAAKLILEQSNLQIRILSKCSRIVDIAADLSEFQHRVVYGLSTGTCLDEISRSIEMNASPIKERVSALYWLQDNGYRTFGMICPVLPSEKGRVSELLDQVRPEKCEAIWVEALNDKGSSLFNTLTALNNSGLEWHAYALSGVMKSKDHWRNYTQDLYLGFRRELRKIHMLPKLRFLQYTTKADQKFFEPKHGAICL